MREARGVVSLGVVVVMSFLSATVAGAGSSDARTPTVSGPVTGGRGDPVVLSTNFDLASVGYTREEYFVAGDAVAYRPDGELGADGKWKVTEGKPKPFTTRIVVYKPADPSAFNGTVFVEWLNVSAGFETATDWMLVHNQIIRMGAAWVGVSAQQAGVQGGAEVIAGATEGGLKGSDPERYASLTHPGDQYSYDLYTQAGIAVSGDADGVNPFEGYDVQRVIAMGESQSAFRMTTYVNAVHPRVGVYDGFLVHSRGGSAAPFGASDLSLPDKDIPAGVRIRTDLDVPVLTFQTETDLTLLQSTPSRQPDTSKVRLWEVAGTSHADAYTGALGFNDVGDGSAELTLLDPAQASGGPLACETTVNAGAQYAVLSAALQHLDTWVADGTPPPKAPRLKTTGRGENVSIVRDDDGIALGGIRTPIVDAPIAVNTGEENQGGRFCTLFGTTAPLDAAALAARYPGGTEEWREKFAKATEEAVDAGFWLQPEADNFVAASEQITLS